MENLALPVLVLLTGTLGIAWVAVLLWERRRRRAVERALYNEVISLRWQAAALAEEIARRHIADEPFDSSFFDLWPLSGPLIYPSTGAAALGLLSREGLGCVGLFYGQLADARARLANARKVGSFEPSPYRVLSGLMRAHYGVDPWVRALRTHLGTIPGAEPDITAANKLMGELEESLAEPVAVPYCWVECGQS